MNIGPLFNIKNYKMAKGYSKDIETILKHVDTTIIALTPFTRYRAVARILAEVKDNKAVLQAHYTKFQQIIASKGEVKEESK